MFTQIFAQHRRVTSASRVQTEGPAPQRVNDASHDLQSRDDHHSSCDTDSYDVDERVIIQVVDHDDETSELEPKVEWDVSQCSCNEGNPHCQRCNDLYSDSDVSDAVEEEIKAGHDSVSGHSPLQYISYEMYTPPTTDEDLFRTLSMDRRNLVLDSVDPDVAPHIVITPPPFDWNDCFTAYDNLVHPQDPVFLTVPQSYGGWEIKAATPEPVEYVESAPVEQEMDCADMDCGEMGEIPDDEPLKVFSRSKFERQISASLNALEHMSSIHRQRCKQIAELAARRAQQILATLGPSLQTLLEDDTFTWTDPAEALLADMTRYFGTTILPSENPFTAPHIVINEPPPMGPSDAAKIERNSTPFQCATGHNLCVPNWYYGFSEEYYYEWIAQTQPHWTETHVDASWVEGQAEEVGVEAEDDHHIEHWEVFDEYAVEDGQMQTEMQDEALAVSRPETPMPSTPTDDEAGRFNFMPSIAVDSTNDLLHQDVDSPVMVSTASAQSLCGLMAKGLSSRPVYVFGDLPDSGISDDTEDSGTLVRGAIDVEMSKDSFAQPLSTSYESTPCGDSAAYYEDEDEDGPPPFDDWYTSWTPRIAATA